MSIESLSAEYLSLSLEDERAIQYRILGKLGVIMYLTDAANLLYRDPKHKQFNVTKELLLAAKLFRKPSRFKTQFERGKFDRSMPNAKSVLYKFAISNQGWKLDPIFKEALAKHNGQPISFDSQRDINRLDPLFYYEIYPYFSKQHLPIVADPEYFRGLASNLTSDIPEFQGIIEYYVGEYDPRR